MLCEPEQGSQSKVLFNINCHGELPSAAWAAAAAAASAAALSAACAVCAASVASAARFSFATHSASTC